MADYHSPTIVRPDIPRGAMTLLEHRLLIGMFSHEGEEDAVKGRALQLLLSGAPIDAGEAYRIGLVNEVVPTAELIARAEAIVNEIAANAPIAVKLTIDAVNKGFDADQSVGLALEAACFGICAATEDKKEGTTAFLEKRVPRFQAR